MAASERYQIRVVDCGESYTCGVEQTLLAGMEALGRRGIPVGCRGGGCGVCKIRILAGEYYAGKMSSACVSKEERACDIVLACKTYPRSDLELEAVGAIARRLAPMV